MTAAVLHLSCYYFVFDNDIDTYNTYNISE